MPDVMLRVTSPPRYAFSWGCVCGANGREEYDVGWRTRAISDALAHHKARSQSCLRHPQITKEQTQIAGPLDSRTWEDTPHA